MNEPSIYLDNNATTRIDRQVTEAISGCLFERLANPASQHTDGRKARAMLEAARASISQYLGCRTVGMGADQIVLTSGGTESNNLAISGLLHDREGDLVVSSVEHPSILSMAEAVGTAGQRRVRILPVDSNGQVCLTSWNRCLTDHIDACQDQARPGKIALVSVMVANNETGSLQPVEAIAASASAHGILVHSDAVQAVGKLRLEFAATKLDAMSVTAHKLHGPVGIGALIVRQGVRLSPMLHGGFQQLGMRPGTECVALAVGFAKALEKSMENIDRNHSKMMQHRELLESLLLAESRPPTIIASGGPRAPHTISLAYPGIERQALQMALDRNGIACSTGSACASGSGQPSHVLQAMQLPSSIVNSAIRLSLSSETTREEIQEAARRICKVVKRFPNA